MRTQRTILDRREGISDFADGNEVGFPERRKLACRNAALFVLQALQELEWDNKLNDDLLKLAVRAIDEKNESLRFGLVLRSRFSIVESRFGDGFFNAVLRLYLESSGFGELPAVSNLLNEIHCYNPSPGEGLDRCVEMIESVLRSCVESLREDLKYSKEQTIAIMGKAIATYLDERFHVSERKALGFS